MGFRSLRYDLEADVKKRFEALFHTGQAYARRERPEPRRCPVCGCYQFVYKGDKQVCRDCGRE